MFISAYEHLNYSQWAFFITKNYKHLFLGPFLQPGVPEAVLLCIYSSVRSSCGSIVSDIKAPVGAWQNCEDGSRCCEATSAPGKGFQDHMREFSSSAEQNGKNGKSWRMGWIKPGLSFSSRSQEERSHCKHTAFRKAELFQHV